MAKPGKILNNSTGILGEILLSSGALVGLFILWQFWWTDVIANQESAQIDAALGQEWATNEPAPTKSAIPTPVVNHTPPTDANAHQVPTGEAFARLHIPKFAHYWDNRPRPIVRGVEKAQIDKAIGHYPQNSGPGQLGNFAIAGHRTTYGGVFRHVDSLTAGDAIVVETKNIWYTYRVVSHRVGAPGDVKAIAPVPDQPEVDAKGRYLTMTTCHPLRSMRQRYLVFAELDSWHHRRDGLPPALQSQPVG